MQSLLATLSPATATPPATDAVDGDDSANISNDPASNFSSSSCRRNNEKDASTIASTAAPPSSAATSSFTENSSKVQQAEHRLACLERQLLMASTSSTSVDRASLLHENVADEYANRVLGMRADNLRHAFLSMRIALNHALPSSANAARLSIKVARIVLHRLLYASTSPRTSDAVTASARGNSSKRFDSHARSASFSFALGMDDDDDVEYDQVCKLYDDDDENNDLTDIDNEDEERLSQLQSKSFTDIPAEEVKAVHDELTSSAGEDARKKALEAQKVSTTTTPLGSSSPPRRQRSSSSTSETADSNVDASDYRNLDLDIDEEIRHETQQRNTSGLVGVAPVDSHTVWWAIGLVNEGLRLFAANEQWLSDRSNAQAYVSGWVCRGLLYDALYRAGLSEEGYLVVRRTRINTGASLESIVGGKIAGMGKVVRGARGESELMEGERTRRRGYLVECIRSLEIGLARDSKVVGASGENGGGKGKGSRLALWPLAESLNSGSGISESNLVRLCGVSVHGVEKAGAAVALARAYCDGVEEGGGDALTDSVDGGRRSGKDGLGVEAARRVLHGVEEMVEQMRKEWEELVRGADGLFVCGDCGQVKALLEEAQVLVGIVKTAPSSGSTSRCIIC